jgi:hypothetical protein
MAARVHANCLGAARHRYYGWQMLKVNTARIDCRVPVKVQLIPRFHCYERGHNSHFQVRRVQGDAECWYWHMFEYQGVSQISFGYYIMSYGMECGCLLMYLGLPLFLLIPPCSELAASRSASLFSLLTRFVSSFWALILSLYLQYRD